MREQGSGRLSRSAIAEAALGLLETVGVEGLTMRRLATCLGAAPMSLYRHVTGKDDLLGLVGAELAARLHRPPADVPWDERIVGSLLEVRRTLLPLGGATHLLSVEALASSEALDLIESMLAALAEGGFTPVEAADALATLWAHTLGDVMVEQAPLGGPGRDLGDERARVTAALLNSGSERAPLLVAATRWSETESDERFERGVRALLAGLSAARARA